MRMARVDDVMLRDGGELYRLIDENGVTQYSIIVQDGEGLFSCKPEREQEMIKQWESADRSNWTL